MQIHAQQTAARNSATVMNFLDFTSLFDGNTFDEEVSTDTQFIGLVRDENGMLQVYAEFTYNGETDEDGERMGLAWSL